MKKLLKIQRIRKSS